MSLPTDPDPTVSAILDYIRAQNDKLTDLRVERCRWKNASLRWGC
jgi:hypothetical protein